MFYCRISHTTLIDKIAQRAIIQTAFAVAQLKGHLGGLTDFGSKFKDAKFRKGILACSKNPDLRLSDEK
jgi:hypothetical protein